jgi:hypothetical protein
MPKEKVGRALSAARLGSRPIRNRTTEIPGALFSIPGGTIATMTTRILPPTGAQAGCGVPAQPTYHRTDR